MIDRIVFLHDSLVGLTLYDRLQEQELQTLFPLGAGPLPHPAGSVLFHLSAGDGLEPGAYTAATLCPSLRQGVRYLIHHQHADSGERLHLHCALGSLLVSLHPADALSILPYRGAQKPPRHLRREIIKHFPGVSLYDTPCALCSKPWSVYTLP